MLELIFQGFLEWTYGLVLEAWEYFSSVLLDLMSLDFAYLRDHMPIIDTIMEIMLAVGWALLIGNLVFQAVKGMMTGLGFEAEDPKLLFTRTFVFAFLLLASPQICQIGLDMTSTIIDLLEMPDAVDITFADEASFGGLAGAWLLVILYGVIVMFQTFKLIMEMAERYFVLAILTITAPLAFGMGGSRNTSDIFTGWCRMFGSMCLLMAMNVVFMKMLLSVLSFYPSGLDVLPWMVLVVTIVKVAKKADSILSRIGLNPAMTGDGLGYGVPGALAFTVVRSMVSTAASTIGKAGKGGKAGSGSAKPNGPRTSGPAGTHAGTSSISSHNRNQSSASQQTSVNSASPQESSSQQNTATQQDTLQFANSQSGVSMSSAAQAVRSNAQHSSRNTAVPGGTKRAPSYVSMQNTDGSNMAVSQKNLSQSAQTNQNHNQAGNIPAAVAAAVTAGSVVRGARNLPSNSPPVSKAVGSAVPKVQHATTQQQTSQSQLSAQRTPQTAQQGYHAPNHADTTVHPTGVPPKREVMSTSAPAARNDTSKSVPAGNTPTPKSSVPHAASVAAGTAGSTPVQEVPAARSTGRAADSAGVQKHSIGGRYINQDVQNTHSQYGSQSHLSSTQQTQAPTQQPEARSTNRERSAAAVPAGMAQVASGTSLHTGSKQQTAVPTMQPDTGSANKNEVRSTQRQVQAGNNMVSTASSQTNVQVEQKSSQRTSVHAAAMAVSAAGGNIPAQQEGHTIPKAAPTVPSALTQASAAHTEPRSTQRTTTPTKTGDTAIPASHSTRSPAKDVFSHASASQPEQRTSQRPVAPASTGASPTSGSVQQDNVKQDTRQSRNAAPMVPTTVVTSGNASPSARQESRSTIQATPMSSGKRPVPAQQESHRSAENKRTPTTALHNGTAGMIPPPVAQSTPGTRAAQTTQQEQGQLPKKTFVPLSGKQPESIPSHLELKQDTQRSTKLPDAQEGVSHGAE